MPISGSAKTFSALLYHLVANTARTLVTSFHVRISSRVWQAVENQVHSIYLVLHLLMSAVVASEAKRAMIGGVKIVLARAQGWYFKAMDDPGRR